MLVGIQLQYSLIWGGGAQPVTRLRLPGINRDVLGLGGVLWCLDMEGFEQLLKRHQAHALPYAQPQGLGHEALVQRLGSLLTPNCCQCGKHAGVSLLTRQLALEPAWHRRGECSGMLVITAAATWVSWRLS